MFTRWTSRWTRLRRMLSRNEWTVRLLGLPREQAVSSRPGLVLIQIDGLSRTRLEKALGDGRMPRLSRMLSKEGYDLHTLYSGLPSSTPSVQGELFYGHRSAVPAFSFFHSRLGRVVSMYEAEPATEIEERIGGEGPSLLEGGSAYCDVYTGGAREAHFCAPTVGWAEAWKTANPFRVALAALLHFGGFARVVALMGVELVRSVVDFFRGTYEGYCLWQELKFIPARVGVGILLRELCVVGASADVTRGLPIIHLNLLGYDEQAHRRGPDSALAYSSLVGIDRAIGRIWSAAHRSSLRHYEVWVYSDHGQEPTTPFDRLAGHSLATVVEETLAQVRRRRPETPGEEGPPNESVRADWLGGGALAKWLLCRPNRQLPGAGNEVRVVANGPIGLVYFKQSLAPHEKHSLARRLVEQQGCPMVVLPTEPGAADAYTPVGRYRLPEEAGIVFGLDHPFRDEVAQEMVQLCRHPLGGDLLVCGWNSGGDSVSFAAQNGAHAGAGPEETRAFALIPRSAPLEPAHRSYLRPDDLRIAALSMLGRHQQKVPARPIEKPADHGRLRVMTYNVHGCLGMDGKLSPDRIARVISRSGADIIALQELDIARPRSMYEDQAHEIAGRLDMNLHFHAAWNIEEEQYGNAILSHLPMRLVQSGSLSKGAPSRDEPRGALWVEIDLGGSKLQLMTLHLGVWPKQQRLQLDALLGPAWLDNPEFCGPRIVCGDFNFTEQSRFYACFPKDLRDACVEAGRPKQTASWNSWHPVRRIDHLLVSEQLHVARLSTIRTELARNASDHLPVVADVVLQTAVVSTEP